MRYLVSTLLGTALSCLAPLLLVGICAEPRTKSANGRLPAGTSTLAARNRGARIAKLVGSAVSATTFAT